MASAFSSGGSNTSSSGASSAGYGSSSSGSPATWRRAFDPKGGVLSITPTTHPQVYGSIKSSFNSYNLKKAAFWLVVGVITYKALVEYDSGSSSYAVKYDPVPAPPDDYDDEYWLEESTETVAVAPATGGYGVGGGSVSPATKPAGSKATAVKPAPSKSLVTKPSEPTEPSKKSASQTTAAPPTVPPAYNVCADLTDNKRPAPASQPSELTPAPPMPFLENGGHTAQIRSVIFTADGNCLISAGDDKVIRIWSLATGRSERILRGEIEPGEKGAIKALALSPDGALLAAAGDMAIPEVGHPIRVYDLRSGEIAFLLTGHTDVVRSLAFAPDGTLLLSGSSDKTAILWDVEAQTPVRVLKEHTEPVVGVAFLPDGKKLVTASQDRTARIWPASSSPAARSSEDDDEDDDERSVDASIATLKGHSSPLTALAIAADGRIVTGSGDGVVKLWSSAGKLVRNVAQLGFVPGALATGTDEDRAVVTCADRCEKGFEQRILDLAAGKVAATYKGHDGIVFPAAVRSDGVVATAGSIGHEIHLWPAAGGSEPSAVLKGTGRAVSATGFYPDGQTFAWSHTFAQNSHQVRGQMELSFDLPTAETRLGAPNGVAPYATAGFVHAAPRFEAWSVGHGTAAARAKDDDDDEDDEDEAPKPGKPGAKADVLQITEGKANRAKITPDQSLGKAFEFRTYGFAPSGLAVLAAGDSGLVAAYDLQGRQVVRYTGHSGTVWGMTPSPDGRFLLTGGADQTVKLWSLATGELVVTLFHGADGEWVIWTPQGYYAGSPGGGELIGWHVNRGDNRAASFVKSQQLREHLHRPDIVQRAIAEASSVAAVEKEPASAFDPEQALSAGIPPAVTSIDGDREASGGRGVIVVGLAANPLPVDRLDVWIRDRKVAAKSVPLLATHKAEPGITYQALDIPLFADENDIRVVATNSVGSSDQSDRALSFKITHRGEGALDKRGTLRLLMVGVDNYPDMPKQCSGPDGSCDLRFAGRDAEVFAATAKAEMLSAHEKVETVLLTNRPGADGTPTRANILAALKRIEAAAQPNDTVALLMAGHGINHKGRFYFLPTDVAVKGEPPDKIDWVNHLDWSEVQQTVNKLQGRRLLFLDACRASDSYYHRLMEDAKVNRFVAFSAATGSQSAEESAELQHGEFTFAITKGLKGEAEDKVTRAVHVYDLASYVSKEVGRRTKGRQTPEFFATPGEGNFALVKR